MRDFTDDLSELRKRHGEAEAYLKIEELRNRRPQLETEIRQRKLQERLEAMKTSAKVTFDEAFFGPAAVPPPAADAPVAPTPKQ